MKKIPSLRVAVLIIFILLPSGLARAESLTITTYYPSPYGNYREMRSKRVAIGDNYINAGAYVWGSGISSDADLVVEGDVGIGNIAPGSRLVVQGEGATSATSALNVTDSSATSSLYVRDDRNVGIGNTTPGSRLVVQGSGATSATSSLNVTNSAGSSSLYIGDDRKVGIATTSPSSSAELTVDATPASLYGIYIAGTPIGSDKWAFYAPGYSYADYLYAQDIYLYGISKWVSTLASSSSVLYIKTGSLDWRYISGVGYEIYPATVTDANFSSYSKVAVFLSGVDVTNSPATEDHKITRTAFWISSPAISGNNVTFTIECDFYDKSPGDDSFYWKVAYVILAYN